MEFLSTTDANAMLDARITALGTLYVGLSTSEPTINDAVSAGASGITEPSGGAYARVSLAASGWAAASNRIKSTSVDITFPDPTDDWGTITHVVVFTAATGGRVVLAGPLDDEVTIVSGGDAPKIPSGTLALALPV